MKFWSLVFSLLVLWVWPLWTQTKVHRGLASPSLPQQYNETAILECLPKLKGFLTSEELEGLDLLKIKIERIYGLKRPLIQYRELHYKTQGGEHWKVEFYLMPHAVWGKEKYQLRYFKPAENKTEGAFIEFERAGKSELLDRDAILKMAQYEIIESDERWESFVVPLDPAVVFKSKDFKIFEMKVTTKAQKMTLSCNVASGHPFCQCSKIP